MNRPKNPIHRNESFSCINCGHHNPPLPGSCRNHCRSCLYSQHVDLDTPGDRASSCQALMKPVGIDYSGKKGHMIIHECQKCGKHMKNKLAPDDEQESFLKLQSSK